MADTPIIGMYVHQHWGYKNPYAARTWTLTDWSGYLDGLKRLGYNTVLIWPVLETIPLPLTPSDDESLKKIAAVIDMAHEKYQMKVFITIGPNAAAKNEEANKYTFQDRPFFYCDYRVDPGDPAALAQFIERQETLFRPLGKADGMFVIDSDPGGYPGSRDHEFIYLLGAYRRMLDRIRPGISLEYWIHVGWEAYCDFYENGELRIGSQEEIESTLQLLAKLNPEPWGMASGRGANVADALGLSDKVMTFLYGRVEGEPSFPFTNYGGDSAWKAGNSPGVRGGMANSQTHCVQLPNTFAFVNGALNNPIKESDYVQFAEQLLPGNGACIVSAWDALSGTDISRLQSSLTDIEKMMNREISTGPLEGLLFGDPKRFVSDLFCMLKMKKTLVDLDTTLRDGASQKIVGERLGYYAEASAQWQGNHGYRNNWYWPPMEEPLQLLNAPEVNAALSERNYLGEGDTPFERLQDGFSRVETFTPRLIEAMRQAAKRLASE